MPRAKKPKTVFNWIHLVIDIHVLEKAVEDYYNRRPSIIDSGTGMAGDGIARFTVDGSSVHSFSINDKE